MSKYIEKEKVMSALHDCIVSPAVDPGDDALVSYNAVRARIDVEANAEASEAIPEAYAEGFRVGLQAMRLTIKEALTKDLEKYKRNEISGPKPAAYIDHLIGTVDAMMMPDEVATDPATDPATE